MEETRPAKIRKRVSLEVEECPICMQAFGVRRRTKANPFACSGIPHSICCECNRRMYIRHDDSCPLCRAARTDARSMGLRPPPSNEHVEFFDALTGYALATPVSQRNSLIVFPVDNGDGPSAELLIFNPAAAPVGDPAAAPAAASTLVSSIVNDPAFHVAVEGLQNPDRISVSSFLRRIRAVRRGQNSFPS